MTEKGSKLPQILAVTAASLSALAMGAVVGWSSPIVTKLEKDGGPLGSSISSEQVSWIISVPIIGLIVGSFTSGYLGEKWGPKRILLSNMVLSLIGWTLVATAGHIVQLYVSQFMFGLFCAISFTFLPIYCGEIAETSIRGALGSFLNLFITIGTLYAFCIGPFVSYQVFWILCAILPLIFLVCFIMMPESPYFFLRQGRRDEAIASLARLRGKSEAAVQNEADEIQVILERTFKDQVSIWELIKVKANYKALTYTCAMVSFQQFSGINMVMFNIHNIFLAAGGFVSSEIASIIIAAVQVLASLVAPAITDRAGRRVLLIFSSIGEAVGLCVLGLYFYLKEQHADDVVEKISWLPVVALVIFVAAYNVGWGPLPWAVMGEIFASNIKAKASSITGFVCWVVAFITMKFSSNLEEAFNGKYAIFWIFGGFCIISILFTILVLPETKGKTFQQIQDELSGETSTSGDEEVVRKHLRSLSLMNVVR